jgi:hypothetical protein
LATNSFRAERVRGVFGSAKGRVRGGDRLEAELRNAKN